MAPAAALGNIFSDSKTALFNNTLLQMQNTSHLVQEILGKEDDGTKALREAFSVFRSNRTQNEFNERILSRIRSRVNGVFSHTPVGMSPVFSSLGALIHEMAAGSTSNDAQDLRTQIGNLVPGVMVGLGRNLFSSTFADLVLSSVTVFAPVSNNKATAINPNTAISIQIICELLYDISIS
jgi:hypothetical protein